MQPHMKDAAPSLQNAATKPLFFSPDDTRLIAGARPIYARVNLSAITHNLALLKSKLSGYLPMPRIWATVKANAYGHGLTRIVPALAQADGLAVQHLQEALLCRKVGWQKPIIVYGGLFSPSELPFLEIPDLHLVISNFAQLDWLENAPDAQACTLWLRYHGDTHHCGFSYEDYPQAYARAIRLLNQGRVIGVGHFNHYACAESIDEISKSANIFNELIKDLPGATSTSNSAALLLHSELSKNTDWVRPGLALYGASPLPADSAEALGLQPAMSLHSELIGVQNLVAGDKVGYGATFTAPTDMRIGLVSCGYADGYPRHAPTGTPIIVGTTKTRLIGRVSMDTLALDLNPIPDAQIGTPVTLWGTPSLPAEHVAAAAGTIAAELFTGLTNRVRIYTLA